MQLGMTGLGRMGANKVRRVTKAGHQCIFHDVHAEVIKALASPACGNSQAMWRTR